VLQKRKFLCLLLCVALLVAMLVTVGCGGDKPEGKVVISSKQFAESLVLAHMAAMLIEHDTDLEADISKIGMGATEMLHPALVEGQIDIYPEYTGTAWMVVLEGDVIHDRQEIYEKTKEAYQDQFKVTCLEPLGFQNTFAIAMPAEVSNELNIKTLSDLAEHHDLTFVGDSTTFTRADVYLGLQETYGIDMKQKVVDTALFYDALADGHGHVTTCFSTDGRLKEYQFVVLEDDKSFFPPYDALYVVRSEILEQFPEIEEALKPLFGSIDEETMIDLNFKVEVENQDPADVAEEYLKSRGLI